MSIDDSLSTGDRLPSLTKTPSRIQLFRYSAITWNTHRIHYDPAFAREEGHSDVLVQQHFHGALIQELLMDWSGPEGRLVSLSWQNIEPAIPDKPLTVCAEVRTVEREHNFVEFEVWTSTEEGKCTEGTARISFD